MAEKYKNYMCLSCGWIYDEAKGWLEDEIQPGTYWDDVGLNWRCPDCNGGKMDFEVKADTLNR